VRPSARLLDQLHGVGQHEVEVGIRIWLDVVDDSNVDLLDVHWKVIVVHATQRHHDVHTGWEASERCDAT
jgi:hypothetical protein